jgi:ATPase family associated with various cellular activities (AAA)
MSAPIMTDETSEEALQSAEAITGSASSANTSVTWFEANQRYLASALSTLSAHLKATLHGDANDSVSEPSAHVEDTLLDPGVWIFSQPPALEQLCSAFELSAFERGILLLAAGAEMDSQLAAHYASLDTSRRPLPTLQLALTVLPEAHWSALSPSRALRRWQLIDLLAADTLITSAFRPNERILHFLAGVSGIDERLQYLVHPVPPPEMLPLSYADVASQVAAVWTDSSRHATASSMAQELPLIELCGSEPDANRAIAARAAAALNLRLYRLSPRHLLQTSRAETSLFLHLWEREAVLSGTALLLESEDQPTADTTSATLALLLESLRAPLILSSRQPLPTLSRPRVVFYTSKPSRAEQAELWRTLLQSPHAEANETLVDTLVAQFNLAPIAIRSAAQRANGAAHHTAPLHSLTPVLWEACRIEARPSLEGLAQRIEPTATWDDLVLPHKEREQMRHISLHVRQRTRVYECWGFADRSSRGLGISVLFAGPSGTGKTTAAEVLAHELRLDLFRIDLSQIISKYIGETEKNLCRVFDAADQGAAVLLFDEADALFGKRTEVKDSHDRYANCEVSYLLQRMEAYRGLAILTTNRKSSLDQAFLRRLRFVVEFPFPEAAQRAEIWRRIFPARTPVDGLNVERLSRLRISGGNIHNIAMGAAFLAADAGEPVRMEHLRVAARTEFAKLEIPLNDAEVAGWI